VAKHSDPQIRRLETADAALYREIRLEALEQNPQAFGSTFERENRQPRSWFEAAVSQRDIFGAFVQGTLAGMAGYAAQESPKHAHKGVLWGMYVRPAARNSGLGKRLVEAVLDHARERVEALQLTVVRKTKRPAGFMAAWDLSSTALKSAPSSRTGDITTRS
jgi:ribosomal protein S18 acetylase RimI-like enzyme